MGVITNLIRRQADKKNVLVLPLDGVFERMLAERMPDYNFYILPITPIQEDVNLPNVNFIEHYNSVPVDYLVVNNTQPRNYDVAIQILTQTQAKPVYFNHANDFRQGHFNVFREFHYSSLGDIESANKDINVLIYGAHPYQNARNTPTLTFSGFTSYKDKLDLFSRAKYCLFNRDELNTPNLVYAFAHGCIPIIFNNSIYVEIIQHGINGIVLNENESPDMAADFLNKNPDTYNAIKDNCTKFYSEFFKKQDYESIFLH